MSVLELNFIPTTQHYVSEAEYWANYYHDEAVCYEWRNGQLETKKPPSITLRGFYFTARLSSPT